MKYCTGNEKQHGGWQRRGKTIIGTEPGTVTLAYLEELRALPTWLWMEFLGKKNVGVEQPPNTKQNKNPSQVYRVCLKPWEEIKIKSFSQLLNLIVYNVRSLEWREDQTTLMSDPETLSVPLGDVRISMPKGKTTLLCFLAPPPRRRPSVWHTSEGTIPALGYPALAIYQGTWKAANFDWGPQQEKMP